MQTLSHHLSGKNLLIYNNQCGGGHRVSVEALSQRVIEYKGTPIVKDVFKDVLGDKIACAVHDYWNHAMKSEDVEKLKAAPKMQPVSEFFIWLPEFFHALWWLLAYKVDAVVNPQPAALHAISKAVRVANFINTLLFNKKEEILIYNVLTELPTKHTSDFFNTYRRLSDEDRRINRLITLKPLLDNGQKEEDFWKDHTGFDMSHIVYDEFPLRKPFIGCSKMNPKDIKSLNTVIKSDKAVQLLNEVSAYPIKDKELSKGEVSIDLEENDSVSYIMLGSQAAEQSTLKYVTDFIAVNQKEKPKEKKVLFVFCGDCHQEGNEKSLFEQACDTIKAKKQQNEYPDNIYVIPLENQQAEQVAPIIRKSRMSITRAGGLTALELLNISMGKIMIHSSHADPLRGMPDWEAGNVLYLQKFKEARFITRNVNPFEAAFSSPLSQ